MESFRQEVTVTLPSLTDECLVRLLAHLEALGLEEVEDLKYLKEGDLSGVLKPIQCRKLLGKYTATDSQKSEENVAFQHYDAGRVTMRNPPELLHSRRARIFDSGVSVSSTSSTTSSQEETTTTTQTDADDVFQDTDSVSTWSPQDDEEHWSDYDDYYQEEFPEDELMEKHTYMNVSEWRFLEKQGAQLHTIIARELLTTERSYVGSLHTIYYVFYIELEKEDIRSSFLPDKALSRIFSNTLSIYKLHNEFLLPQLEERLGNWKSNPRIGDIMKSNAPFLKIYTEYVNNMRPALSQIDQLMKRSKRFNEIINRLEHLSECKHLALQHHMVAPMQRLTKYEMLMKEYLRALPPDSPDKQESLDALCLISQACLHSIKTLKKIEIFQKLLDVYKKLSGVPRDFITPTRQLIADGPVTEISPVKRENQLRHLFLFNDVIFIATENKTTNTFIVWKSLDMEGLKVIPRLNALMSNTFELSSKDGTCLLLDQNLTGVTFGWEKKIQAVADIYVQRKKARLSFDKTQSLDATVVAESKQLGLVPPVLISDPAITKCMICDGIFTFLRRKKNCKACGKLICKFCGKRAPLKYKEHKSCTVCLACFNNLSEDTQLAVSTSNILEDTSTFSNV